MPSPHDVYQATRSLTVEGRHDDARLAYGRLYPELEDPEREALIVNDLAVLSMLDDDDLDAGYSAFGAIPSCQTACLNAAFLLVELGYAVTSSHKVASSISVPFGQSSRPARVAILSFLFNWPSSGGGNVHTAELARFRVPPRFLQKYALRTA